MKVSDGLVRIPLAMQSRKGRRESSPGRQSWKPLNAIP
jgi:hypothetical protein